MRYCTICFLFLLALAVSGCSQDQEIDIEVYDDIAVIEGVIIPVTEDRILTEIRDNHTILLHFTSYDYNCGYCVRSNTFVNRLAQDLAGELRVGRVSWNPWHSIDGSADLLRKFQASGIPFLLLCKNGGVVWRYDGYQDQDAQLISAEIKKQL